MTRRQALGVAGLATLGGVLSACSTGAVSGMPAATATADVGQFPVTIKHAFGETTITGASRRVAVVGTTSAEIAVQLGIVPVGLPKNDWAGTPHDSVPWFDEQLVKLGAPWGSASAPVQYSEDDGVNFTEVAKTEPDLILAVQSGISQEDYTKLVKIAPVVAFPDNAWATGWEQSTRMVGQALGKSSQAETLVEDTKAMLAAQSDEYPELRAKTFIGGSIAVDNSDVSVVTPIDTRSRLLEAMGLTVAPVLQEALKDAKTYYEKWSTEKSNELVADVFISWLPDSRPKQAAIDDPLIGQIPALKAGHYLADTDKALIVALSTSSPLSLAWAVPRFSPKLAAAVRGQVDPENAQPAAASAGGG